MREYTLTHNVMFDVLAPDCRHGTAGGCAACERESKYPEVPTYFRTPEEHVAALMDTTIRALEQLWTLRYVKDRQPLEMELASIEATMKRLRKDVPA